VGGELVSGGKNGVTVVDGGWPFAVLTLVRLKSLDLKIVEPSASYICRKDTWPSIMSYVG
jgi:hypothetical protein